MDRVHGLQIHAGIALFKGAIHRVGLPLLHSAAVAKDICHAGPIHAVVLFAGGNQEHVDLRVICHIDKAAGNRVANTVLYQSGCKL